MKGKMIAFTGIDGAGKTLHSNLMVNTLKSRNVPATYLSGSLIIKRKFPDPQSLYQTIETLDNTAKSLFWASIYREYANTAIKHMEQGYYVVLDRWDESFLGYNLFYGDFSECHELTFQLRDIIYQGVYPDITYFINATPEVALERLIMRDGINHGEDISTLQSNYTFYSQLSKMRQWVEIEGNDCVENVSREINSHILPIIEGYDIDGGILLSD